MKTTLNTIRSHHPCKSGWEKLLNHLGKTKADDEPIDLITILESNGIQDAVWCLRCFEYDDYRMFNADVAESVLHLFESKYPDDDRPRKAIEAARDKSKSDAYIAAAYDAADAAADAADADAAAAAAAAADAATAAADADAYAADAAAGAYAADVDAAAATATAAANAAAYAAVAAATAARAAKWKEIEQLFIQHFGE